MSLRKFILIGFIANSAGCITTHSTGFVNYKAVGDVYSTKPQAVDYEEVGQMNADASSFFWSSCDNICREAIVDLKYKSKDRGGDSIIDLSYKSDNSMSKTPTCTTNWTWAYLYVLPVFGPWVKTCNVEGISVSRNAQKSTYNQALQQQAAPPAVPAPQININVQQHNTNNSGQPAH